MKIKFLFAFIVSFLVLILVINKIDSYKKNILLKQKTENMQKQYQSINIYLDKIADTVFQGFINRKENIDLFSKKDRINLYKHLKDDYEDLKNLDFSQLHFHTSDNKSFLRFHKLENYGDSLKNYRYSVEQVNKTHKKINGLEIGKILPGFRYVYPLFDSNNSYIGSVENSFSIMAFINQLDSLYNIHTHFILSKEQVDKNINKDEMHNFVTAVENERFYKLNTENCTVGDKRRIVKEVLFGGIYEDIVTDGINSKDPFSFEFIIKGVTKIVTFLPVHDIENTHIGYFVFYYKDNDLKMINKDTNKRYYIFGMILVLIFIVLYKIYSQRDMLNKEVNKQTQKYHKASKELGLKTKELHRLNNSLEDKVKSEVDKNRKKEFELMEASKMVQMGEMIGNIAHQWRQPLSLISTISTSIIVNKELGILDDNTLVDNMNKINDSSQYLSETINTFRNFIKEEKVLKNQVLQENITNAIDIVGTVLRDVNIDLIQDVDYENPIDVCIVSGELPQVIINIINNAKDILLEKELEDMWVKVVLIKEDNKAIITIEDNAGGIPDEILPSIFDPYFTTKHQSVGTGLGLHMSKRIVVESLKGKLYAKNTNFGAKFYIELPLQS
ncbi:MAG: ATP-binding protein [Campylobacterota bacterium]|nr:ATP-binding protein [Campylobacterota bacterium]